MLTRTAIISVLFTLSSLSASAPTPSPALPGRFLCEPAQVAGTLVCTSDMTFAICTGWDIGSEIMGVAAGTICKDGAIIASPIAGAQAPMDAKPIDIQDLPAPNAKRSLYDVENAKFELERARWV